MAMFPNCKFHCTLIIQWFGLGKRYALLLPSYFLNESSCEIHPGGLVSEPSTDHIVS